MIALLKKPQRPIISESNAWKDDPFKRKPEGEMLSRLISSSTAEPLVLSLQSPWGSGKTTFLQRLQVHMRHEYSIPSVSIDAWKNDESQDPLVTIISEITASLAKKKSASKARPIKDSIGRTISSMAKNGARIILPSIAIGADAISPGTGSIANATGKLGERLLEAQDEKRKAEPDFRESLERARDHLTGRQTTQPIRPIMLIIDELDRCRPDYAIRMLERIKHYFDVPGITFLIATDRGNLPSAVQTVYGAHVDGELYLRKFFDYEFHLSPPCNRTYAKAIIEHEILPNETGADPNILLQTSSYFHDLNERFNNIEVRSIDKCEYLIHFPQMVFSMNLSLRDAAQAMTMLAAFVHSRPKGSTALPVIESFICCLRFAHPEGLRQIMEDSTLFSLTKESPQLTQNIYNALHSTHQWDSIQAFFGSNNNLAAFLGHSYHGEREKKQFWEEIIGGDKREALSSPKKVIKAILSIRVRDAKNPNPWQYAREIIRLTPPTPAQKV